MNNKAFTIIELMIVVAVIFILAGLLLPAINMVRSDARKSIIQRNQQYNQSYQNNNTVTGGGVVVDDNRIILVGKGVISNEDMHTEYKVYKDTLTGTQFLIIDGVSGKIMLNQKPITVEK